jgi:hypothetical protein
MISIQKPPHNKYLLSGCDQDQYCKFVLRYQKAKKYGIRAVVGYLSGSEIYQIACEIAKGGLRTWGRQKAATLGAILIGWVGGPVAIGFTNATKVVRTAKAVHTAAAFILEIGEDTTNISYLPIDLLFFGQPIPMGENNRFNILTNITF